MDSELQLALVALGALVVVLVIYATVRMLIRRHQLYAQIKALSARLAQNKEALTSKQEGFHLASRLKDITYVPPGMVEEADRLTQEVEGKLKKALKPSLWRKFANAREKFIAGKSEDLAKVGPADPIIWVVWHLVYLLWSLVYWALYPLLLLSPAHTMRHLNRRLENLRELGQELNSAIKAVQDLTRSSKFLTDKRKRELEEQAQAKKRAEEIAQKRLVLEDIRRRLVAGVKFHLIAPPSDILCGATLLDITAAREYWGKDYARFVAQEPQDSELDELIALWDESLAVFEVVSLVEGAPGLSKIQRHAERLAESERLIQSTEEVFHDRLTFSAIGVAPTEPEELRKARSLLAEAASHWATFKFERLMDLASAADAQTRQAARNIEDLKRWEDIILAFDRERADIKENEDALAAYGVELPQTTDWQKAVETLEGEVPQVWAAYDWPKLNELNSSISTAFAARAQEVNRRLEAERNKRVAKGQALPQGARRPSQPAAPVPDNGAIPTNGSGSRAENTRGIRYAPDPRHQEPLVWVRSTVTGVFIQVRKSLAGSLEYATVSPNDPDLLDFLQSQQAK